MVIEIPEDVMQASAKSEQDMRLDILAFLYQTEVLTLAQGASLAKTTRTEFQQALNARNIAVHYSIEDVEMDLKHLAELGL